MELENKIALVTGGSRGIGRAIVMRLAEAGADVAFTYARSEDAALALLKDLQDMGRKGLALKADAVDAQSVVSAVRKTNAEFGKIDILVNNAGIFALKEIGEASLDDFELMMSVNVKAVFAATAESVKHMPDNGRIINIGSILGESIGFPGCSLYGMSKGAVQLLTRGWARDLGKRGITVNVVQPGPIDTEMNPADGPMGETYSSLTAINRYGKPEEVADLVVFLAGSKAANITGAALNIDGGLLA